MAKVTTLQINGFIEQGGDTWPVLVSVEIEADRLPELRDKIFVAIDGLRRLGIKPPHSRMVAPPPRVSGASRKPAPAKEEQAAFTWPTPYCEDHRQAMTLSKHQKNPEKMAYYCAQKTSGGVYCNRRAIVDKKTGYPEFFTVPEG